MLIDALLPAAAGALLGGVLAFVGGYIQRQQVERRSNRALIYATLLRDALSETEDYVRRPYREGPLEYMSSERLSSSLKEIYRRALITSRDDELRTRSLWHVALDLDEARRRCEFGEQITRVREGGWEKLSFDTVAQGEEILLRYERWLQRRLLARPRRRHPDDYVRIEINRDVVDPDTTRFDLPAALTTETLVRLLEVPIISWRVRTSVPIYGRVVDLWVRPEDARQTMQRTFETNRQWLSPLGAIEGEGHPDYVMVIAALHAPDCPSPDERTTEVRVLGPEGRRTLPEIVLRELDGALDR